MIRRTAGGVAPAAFILAGAAKITEPGLLAAELYRAGMSESLAGPLAFTLPGFEIALGLLWFAPSHRRACADIAVALLAVFSIFTLLRILRGDHTPCTCFGSYWALAPAPALIRDFGLIALIVFTHRQNRSPAGGKRSLSRIVQ